jgi:hypothetical protein
MTYEGILRGKTIELEDQPALPDGSRVTVDVLPEAAPRKGSPQAILQLVGTLTDEEAELILAGAKLARQVDPHLWEQPE